jgi:hypothetical protein
MSDLSELKGMADKAMNAIRDHKPANAQDDLLARYRKQHEDTGCTVIVYEPTPKLDRLDLLADARCQLCREFDKKRDSAEL